jgi:hypothetical protein
MSTLKTDIAEQVQQEHADILALLKKLKGLAHSASGTPDERLGWQDGVESSLSSLCSHLKAHFTFEESGGFMTEVVNALPNLALSVVRLKEDHKVILAQSEELQRIAEEDVLTSENLSNFILRVLSLIRNLEQHEHKEMVLVQGVFVEDSGITD